MSPRPRCGIAPPPPALGGGGGGGAAPPLSKPDITQPSSGLQGRPDTTPRRARRGEVGQPASDRDEIPVGGKDRRVPGGVGSPGRPVLVEGWLAEQHVLNGAFAPVAEPRRVLFGEQAEIDGFGQLVLVLPCPGAAIGW